MLTDILLLAVGLALVIFGADWLVDGASSIARKLGVGEFVIGLTIVGFGTSCPELVVSLTGALQGNADISIGNVVGSNAFNTLLILGITALIAPVTMTRNNARRDIPVTLLVTFLFVVFGLQGQSITRVEGLVFLLLFVVYIWFSFKSDKGSCEAAPSQEDKKEINQGVTRFAATPEVIQSTRFTNGNIDKLLQETGYTYLKTPAGICTEMTLPINEIFNEHPNDSVSLAEVTLQRYNKDQDAYQLGTPGNLLLVRKGQMEEFFAKKSVNDNKTSFITTFDSSHNTYTFTNIARLLSYCWHEKKTAAEKEGITEAAWEAQHPDWNKMVLIPVTVSSNSSGYTTSVNHDMGMNSAKLIGGDTPLKMQVVYSKFK